MNRTHNELKHLCDGEPVYAYYPRKAKEMSARAISYYNCLWSIPPQKTITTWFEEYVR